MIGKKILLVSMVALFMLAFAAPVSDIAKPKPGGNPSPRKDNFSKWPSFGEGQDWRYYIVNGNSGSISVNGPLPFDNSTAEVTSGKELEFRQVYDTDFDAEYPAQYNNIFMIGFQGYFPTTERDIVWDFGMKVEPGVYGTTGFVVERKNTFASDGTIALPFDFFGITYAGPENANTGLRCTNVVDFASVSQDLISGVDPFEWNDYEIRFHFVESGTVLTTISINDIQVCQATRADYGETEIQIWLDNYKVTYDPFSPMGFSLGYNNKETSQSVLFDDIEAKAKPVH